MFKWGVIGTGSIANTVFGQITGSGRHCAVAVYSRTLSKAEKFAKKFNAVCYDDIEKFFADERMDAVYIATPHSAHYRYLTECINHNVPVLTEKSFTVNARQAEAVFQLSKEKGVFVCEAMWTRFQPVIKDVIKWIEDGAIGELRGFDGAFSMPLQICKPFVSERVYKAEYAGGALLDLGVYPVSIAEMLFGVPDKVVCKQIIEENVDLEDKIELYYGNAKCNLSCTFKGLKSFTGTIYGTKGKIVIPMFTRPRKAVLYAGGKKVGVKKAENSYVFQFDKAEEDIRKGLIESSVMKAANTINVMRIMDECRKQNGLVYPERIEKI
ncbi:MAG TPA: Gfo/Idh/MocA family oxidoreductase [Candidatus Faecicola pullistercoris]|nr:Gfo/Idh/MocA family oxidoreductase [Candidatus Faecicola pullistercoris]